jgi:hypothetical protein
MRKLKRLIPRIVAARAWFPRCKEYVREQIPLDQGDRLGVEILGAGTDALLEEMKKSSRLANCVEGLGVSVGRAARTQAGRKSGKRIGPAA